MLGFMIVLAIVTLGLILAALPSETSKMNDRRAKSPENLKRPGK